MTGLGFTIVHALQALQSQTIQKASHLPGRGMPYDSVMMYVRSEPCDSQNCMRA